MNIVKQSTGNVVLTDAAGNIQKVFVNVNALDVKGTDEVVVKFGFNQWHSLFASQIDNTQVEPAAAVAFSGNAFDLVALLSSSFFFELSGGGGSQDLANVLSIGNSTGFQDIDMSFGDLKNTNLIDFNESISVTPTTAQLTFSNTYNTFVAGLGGNSIKLKLGTQEFAQVVNKTTPLVNLLASNYQVCIVAGATGQRLSVRLAKADSDVNSAGTLGLVAENINGNQEGFICTTGTLENLNTSGSLQGETWADGDSLYLSGTSAGAITNVKPSAPIHEVRVGYVEYAHATKGKIYVKIDNGYELDELHNVSINTGTLANNDVLTYESATQLWKNKPVVNPEGWSVIVKSANQDVTNSITLVDDTDMQFSVVAGGQYMIEMDVVISASNTANDYKNALTLSTGTMKGSGILTANSAGTVAQTTNILAAAGLSTNTSAIGTALSDIDLLHSIKIIYSFTASANAILKYQFAQNAATAATTARTFKGSILKYKKIN